MAGSAVITTNASSVTIKKAMGVSASAHPRRERWTVVGIEIAMRIAPRLRSGSGTAQHLATARLT
jgi:hypothetical protein